MGNHKFLRCFFSARMVERIHRALKKPRPVRGMQVQILLRALVSTRVDTLFTYYKQERY